MYKGYDAYKDSMSNASELDQLIMLYDGAIKFTKQAKEAFENNRLDERFNLIEKACAIVNGLRSILDHEKGGNVAKVLDDYYASIDARLIQIQCYDNLEYYETVVRDLASMKSAWEDVKKQYNNESDSDIISKGLSNIASTAKPIPAELNLST